MILARVRTHTSIMLNPLCAALSKRMFRARYRDRILLVEFINCVMGSTLRTPGEIEKKIYILDSHSSYLVSYIFNLFNLFLGRLYYIIYRSRTHIRTHTHTRTHARTHAHTHTHTHAHTHTHTYIYFKRADRVQPGYGRDERREQGDRLQS